jgi:nicotinamidase-related amidase
MKGFKMNHVKTLTANTCQMLVVDFQEKFTPVIPNIDLLLRNTAFALKVADLLKIPITISEQNPAGLGQTVESIRTVVANFAPIPKFTFSCWQSDEIRTAMIAHDRPTVIIAGIETPICILQTSLDLLNAGYNVYILADAVGARKDLDHQLTLQRLAQAGAVIGTTEMAAYELVGRADVPIFKSLLKLMKENQTR